MRKILPYVVTASRGDPKLRARVPLKRSSVLLDILSQGDAEETTRSVFFPQRNVKILESVKKPQLLAF